MAEVLSKFGIKYSHFYEIRNRYLMKSIHAWGTTCFDKTEADNAIAQYEKEQERAQTTREAIEEIRKERLLLTEKNVQSWNVTISLTGKSKGKKVSQSRLMMP